MTAIGEFVKKLRKEKGMSVNLLADLAGVAPATVYRIEDGSTIPQVKVMEKLAVPLGLHLNDLIDQLFIKVESTWKEQ